MEVETKQYAQVQKIQDDDENINATATNIEIHSNQKCSDSLCGITKFEKALCIFSVILFILSIIEMSAFITYAISFSTSPADACCGIISEYSYNINGAVCHERDIQNGNIDKTIINDGYICVINNITCLDYNFDIEELDEDIININEAISYNSLLECIVGGGYELKDLCGSQNLDEQIKRRGTLEAIAWCLIAFIVTLTTSIYNFCGWNKCRFCGRKRCHQCIYKYWSHSGIQAFIKLFEVCVWCLILYTVTTQVENPAINGYESDFFYYDDDEADDIEDMYEDMQFSVNEMVMNNETYADIVDVNWYVKEVCGIQHNANLWIDYDINANIWVLSPVYGIFAYFGIGLSVLEMVLFFIWHCFYSKDLWNLWKNIGGKYSDYKRSKEEKIKTEDAIQMTN